MGEESKPVPKLPDIFFEGSVKNRIGTGRMALLIAIKVSFNFFICPLARFPGYFLSHSKFGMPGSVLKCKRILRGKPRNNHPAIHVAVAA